MLPRLPIGLAAALDHALGSRALAQNPTPRASSQFLELGFLNLIK